MDINQFYDTNTCTLNLNGTIPKNSGSFKLSIPDGCKHIHLDNNGLKGLPGNLQEGIISLTASGNLIKSIPTLPKSLQYLNVSNNKITNLSNLPENLVHLVAKYNNITSLDLKNTKLNTVNISFNKLTKFTKECLPSTLKTLYVTNNFLENIDNLPDNLDLLDASNNFISKIVNVPDELTKLKLANNRLETLDYRFNGKLEDLEVEFNYLDNIPTNLPKKLHGLYLDHNRIGVLENLPENLETLSVESNQIFKINNLPNELRELHLCDNSLSSLENIPNSVEELDISRNRITELKIIPKECTILHAQHNKIRRVKVTKFFKNLEELYIEGNDIQELETLKFKLVKLEIESDLLEEEEGSDSDFGNDEYDNLSDEEIRESKPVVDVSKLQQNKEITAADIINLSVN